MGLLDIIGPVMIGPSSSHTAGAVRLGNFARLVLGDEPRRAEIGLHGSFAATGHGHGTHLAILSGIMGLALDDERIPRAKDLAGESGLEYSLASADLGDVHPNSACMMLYGRNPERKADVCGSSVGGGEIRIWRLDGFEVDLEGRYPTVVLVHADHDRHGAAGAKRREGAKGHASQDRDLGSAEQCLSDFPRVHVGAQYRGGGDRQAQREPVVGEARHDRCRGFYQ
ncbi:MAG: serine dehydratase beta chain [Patescibacteria group bacterium]